MVTIGLFLTGLLIPAYTARQWLLPLAWLWPLPLWSNMGSREARNATGKLVFSAPHPLSNQLPITWLVGVLVALVTGGSVALNLDFAGDTTCVIGWAVAAFFIPSPALAMGVWSEGSKFLEIVYLLCWYAGPLNQVEPLNFMGTGLQVHPDITIGYGITAGFLLLLAILGRWRRLAWGS